MRAALLSLMIIATFSVQAQEAVPFPTSNASWRNLHFEYGFTPPPMFPTNFEMVASPLFSYTNQDTLINSQTYSQLMMDSVAYVAGIRTEDRTVYIIPADSLEEYVLYDFAAEEGDTIHDVFVSNWGTEPWIGIELRDMVISFTDSLLMPSGDYHKLIRTADDSQWIDGVGSASGFLWPTSLNVSNYDHMLARHCHNNTVIYDGNIWGPFTFEDSSCGSLLLSPSAIEELEGLNPLKIFPNPASDMVRLGFPLANDQEPIYWHSAQLIDLTGKVVLDLTYSEAHTSRSELLLDVSAIAKGLYSVILRSEDGTLFSGKLMIE